MKDKDIRALLIEPSEEDERIIIHELKKGGYKPVYERVETVAAMKKALKNKKKDIILCDYKMPNFNTLSAITALKEANIDIPIIVVSGTVSEETAADCIRLGAKDYIIKGNLSRLCAIVERELQVEAKLHLSEEKYRLLLENAGEGVLICQGDRISFANPAIEAMLGYPKEIITTREFTSFIHPDDCAMVLDRHIRRMRGEPVETGYRFRIIAADGKQKWLYITSRIIFWEGVPSSLNFVMDITSHKQAEDEMRASEEKYRLIFENAPLGLLIFDEKGVIVACNDFFVKMIGSSRDKLIGYNMLSLPDKKIVAGVKQALEGHIGFYEGEYSSVTAKKNTPGRCIFAPMETGRGGMVIIEDITERKRKDEELRENEELFRNLFQYHAVIKFIIDPETGDIMDANEAAEKYYGWSREELTHMKIQELNTLPPEKVKALMDKARTGEKTSFELRHRRADGSVRDVQAFSSSIKMKGKDILHSIVIDITEQKRAEKALHQSEERFRSVVENAHEGIFQTTPEGKFRMANQAMARILGYDTPRELMESVTDITHQIYVNPQDRIKLMESLSWSGKSGQ